MEHRPAGAGGGVPTKKNADPINPAGEWGLAGFFFFIAPTLVLAVHPQKSGIVISALAPGVIVLFLALWARLLNGIREGWPAWLFATIVVGASGAYFTAKQIAPANDAGLVADARKINSLADYFFSRTRAAGLASPRIAVDRITDCLDAQIMRVICYERKKTWVPFGMTLPTGIWKEKEEVFFERLAESDFVILTDDGPGGSYPYDEQLAELRPKTHAWCDEHLQLVERFTISGRHMALYQRREIPLP